jgi:hypothetical protein
MREHPEAIRYALLGCFLHIRTREVLDDVIRMAIDMVHRVDVRSDNQLMRELIENLKHVDGKLRILSRIAEAVVNPVESSVRCYFRRCKKRPSGISWRPYAENA